VFEKRIGFYSDGLRLDGTLYLPDGLEPAERCPGVLACSGYLGLNVIYPRLFAEPLTRAGFVVLGFDYRGNGASEGVAGRLLIEEQVRDIKSGLTFLREQPEVEREQVALLGWGMGAGNVVQLAAEDERAKAVVALNGFYNGWAFLQARHGEAELEALLARLEKDRVQRALTGSGQFGNPYDVYPLDPDTRDEVEANLEPVAGFGPETAFELLDSLLAFDAASMVHKLAPRPIFIGHGERNELHPIDGAMALFEQAGEPKTFHRIDGKHNDFMRRGNEVFNELTGVLTAWLADQLKSRVAAR
jgi:fermentation-respiration switch protein FrsA (DUF1100 family)